MMYLLLIFTPPLQASGPIELPTEESGPTGEEFMDFQKAITDAGVLVDSQALDTESVTTVQVRRKTDRIVTDGPFAEAREIVGGYYLIDVPDLDAAVEWAARCPGSRHGTVQVRQVWDWRG